MLTVHVGIPDDVLYVDGHRIPISDRHASEGEPPTSATAAIVDVSKPKAAAIAADRTSTG